MAVNPKFVKLLETLKEATSQGRVQWSETADEDTFRIILDGAIVRVGREIDEASDKSYHSAVLVDGGGSSIEAIHDDCDTEYARLVLDLYELARRSALKVDDLIDRLITSVNARKS